MRILVIGSGGREHALCWKIKQSEKVSKIYCAPGNGGTREIAENIDIKVNEVDKLLAFALDNKIDMTIVGPEEPLVLGIVDKFEEAGLKIFGPDLECAQLEKSKDYAKIFMEKYHIPTAKYKTFVDYEDAVSGLDDFNYPLVIKADGLCLGKGVIICSDEIEAKAALKDILVHKVFGDEGNKVVIEEFLEGTEASLLCFVSNNNIIPMESAKDYKKIYENDLGPNTGGVGCYSPSPLFTPELQDKIKRDILEKISYGLKEEGLIYRGILFIGFMIVDDSPKVLEFNVRFGDPETEVIIPRLNSDIVDLFLKTIDGTLEEEDLIWNPNPCMTVVLTSEGYPSEYKKGFEISGVEKLDEFITPFHNGTSFENDKLLTGGGRVLSITYIAKDLEEARNKIYENIEKIKFSGMHYRKDIGKIN